MARHHGAAHLGGLADARVPFTNERASVTRLSTWTQPLLGAFVLVVGVAGALGIYSWVRGQAARVTGANIPTLDQQMLAITASQAG